MERQSQMFHCNHHKIDMLNSGLNRCTQCIFVSSLNHLQLFAIMICYVSRLDMCPTLSVLKHTNFVNDSGSIGIKMY